MTLSIMALSITMKRDIQHNAEHFDAECLLCSMSFKLRVIYNPFMLSVIMLNVVMLNVMATNSSIKKFYSLGSRVCV